MVLLSQSQVSAALSSAAICLLTLVIFLLGYSHQRKTVSGLQEAIKPRLPQAPPSLSYQSPDRPQTAGLDLQPSRFFTRHGATRVAYADFDEDSLAESIKNVDWKRLGHVQIVRHHDETCNAVMVLAELHRLKSPARRILLFPQGWAVERNADKYDIKDPYLDSSRRLMRLAARRFGVELRPMSPVARDAVGEHEVYSLASAFALADLDRVIAVESPGLLLDARPLDAVLAFTEAADFGMLQDVGEEDGLEADDLLLLRPDLEIHTELKRHLKVTVEGEDFNETTLSTFFSDPLLLASSTSADSGSLIRSVGMLHDPLPDAAFNRTAFMSDVAYIRFSDPKLPGPQYEVPWADKVAARPRNKDADWIWTKLYGDFAQRRLEVCGLSLDVWRT